MVNLYTKSLLTEILTPPSIPPLGGSARPVADDLDRLAPLFRHLFSSLFSVSNFDYFLTDVGLIFWLNLAQFLHFVQHMFEH